MVRFLFTVNVADTLPPTVNDRQTDDSLIVGWKEPVKLASPIVASVAEVGTPEVQLEAFSQAVLTVPRQLVCATNKLLRHNNRKSNDSFGLFIMLDWIN